MMYSMPTGQGYDVRDRFSHEGICDYGVQHICGIPSSGLAHAFAYNLAAAKLQLITCENSERE